MPEIQPENALIPVSFLETPDYSKIMNMTDISESENRCNEDIEDEDTIISDKEVAHFMRISTVRDNVQSAHEKIMNGHYDEILNDPEGWQKYKNRDQQQDAETENTEDNSCPGDDGDEDKVNNGTEFTENLTVAKEQTNPKSLKYLISKEVLENLSQEQCEKIANEVINCYDARVYQPIRAGQHKDEVDVPIMSPPPTDSEPKYELGVFRTNFCRSLAAEFIKGHELKACKFGTVKMDTLLKTLAFPTNKTEKPECICASQNTFDDSLSGWEKPPKFSKSKSGKKRKNSRHSSELAFSRLTGQLIYDKDPFSFQHFKDLHKYIEQYRFLHTMGGVCDERPLTTKSTRGRNMDDELYYNKLRAMASSFDLRTMLKDRENTSSSSSDKNDKAKSDDESIEDSSVDNKILSMKDRGKTLNLAPVRECTVPDLIQAENIDQLQQNFATINQYLNLMTPPLPADCLRIAYEASKVRRYGGRLIHTGDIQPFQPPSPRRAMPLRLGSAEFVKPGTPEHVSPPDLRWSNERKSSMQRSSTFHSGTVPGNLYVGSTVTPSPAQLSRSKSSKQFSASALNQPHSHYSHHSKDAPHLIYGKKFKPCERMNELARDRSRGRDEKVVPLYLNPSDEQNNCARKQDRLISVNVNHLGIRGRTLKSEELSVFYKFDKDKNRRVATLTSNT